MVFIISNLTLLPEALTLLLPGVISIIMVLFVMRVKLAVPFLLWMIPLPLISMLIVIILILAAALM